MQEKTHSSLHSNLGSRERIYVALLAAIQFTHIVDFVVIMPLGPYLMDALNISPDQFSHLVSSYNFSAAGTSFIFATVADRFDRKKLLLLSLLGFILGTLFCGLSSTYEQLLSSRIVTGAFGGTLNAIILAMVADLVPFERRGKAMGVIMSAFSVASVLGIPIGLGIADLIGWEGTFYYIVCLGIVIFGFSLGIIPSLKDHVSKTSVAQALLDYGKVLVRPRYFYSYFFIFLVAMSMFVLIPFLSPYAVKNIGIAKEELKYMYLVGGAFTIITARIFGVLTDSWGALKMFWILAIFAIVPVLLYTNAGTMSLSAYLAMATLFMVLVSGRMIPCMTLLSNVPKTQDRGRFMGLLNSIRSLGSATATLIAGEMIVENSQGVLRYFEQVGHLSIVLIFVTLIMSLWVARFAGANQLFAPISKAKLKKS